MDEQKNAMSEFAIASLVIGITSFINLVGMEKAIAAIIFGILALKKIEQDKQLLGKQLAKAGVILGVFSMIVTATFVIKFLPKIQQQIKQFQSEDGFISEDSKPSSSQPLEEAPKTKLY